MKARLAVAASLLTVFHTGPIATQGEPSPETVIDRAAAYVAAFTQGLSGIVAEERYVQDVRRPSYVQSRGEPTHRELTSDFLLVRAGDAERYVEFRDVFEVDGQPVRDREERLTKLFVSPGGDARLGEIVRESARYNIGRLQRQINTPTFALLTLAPAQRPRFTFSRTTNRLAKLANREETLGDTGAGSWTAPPDIWVVEYRESGRRTIIRTPQGGDVPMRGRLWIDPSNGHLLMTELTTSERGLSATIDVRYQPHSALGLLVPAEMRERYEAPNFVITGTATYRNFRRFAVEVTEVPRLPAR